MFDSNAIFSSSRNNIGFTRHKVYTSEYPFLSLHYRYRKLRNSQPSRILMCLCISLLCLYIFFIILASLKTVTMTTCGIIVGFLHFSLLSSIAWMAVESFNMYLMVIKIFDRGGIRNFMIKAAVFTIGWSKTIKLLKL